MSKIPLDDLSYLTLACLQTKFLRDSFGREKLTSFMEQLSEEILNRRPEKSVSDDEKLLYTNFVLVFSESQQGSQDFWDLLITRLVSSIEKAQLQAKETGEPLFGGQETYKLIIALRMKKIQNPYLWKTLIDSVVTKLNRKELPLTIVFKLPNELNLIKLKSPKIYSILIDYIV